MGKQKSNAKIDIIKVKDRPPQALVSTHSKPKFPPERISFHKKNGDISKKIRKYFFNLSGE